MCVRGPDRSFPFVKRAYVIPHPHEGHRVCWSNVLVVLILTFGTCIAKGGFEATRGKMTPTAIAKTTPARTSSASGRIEQIIEPSRLPVYRVSKRVLDVAVSGMALVMLSLVNQLFSL